MCVIVVEGFIRHRLGHGRENWRTARSQVGVARLGYGMPPRARDCTQGQEESGHLSTQAGRPGITQETGTTTERLNLPRQENGDVLLTIPQVTQPRRHSSG